MGMWWDSMLVHVTYVYRYRPLLKIGINLCVFVAEIGSSVGLEGVLEEKDPTKLK